MNCFVIMPFAQEFDDVYMAIKASVTDAVSPPQCRCFRLDESKPAGRITDRLLQELRTATLCIADVTYTRPNVMWEVGYAMALNHPLILITQRSSDVPFDIRDMQTLQYDRGNLRNSLAKPLKDIVIDTLSAQSTLTTSSQAENLVGQLLAEVADLKNMVAQAVNSWGSDPNAVNSSDGESLAKLAGAWINPASNTHFYGTMLGSDLIVPYCYAGDHELSGAYYGWQRTGELWFVRYASCSDGPAGFAFFRQEAIDVLRGAYWSKTTTFRPAVPPDDEGVPATWVRGTTQSRQEFPVWASQFVQEVKRVGLANALKCKQLAD